jgi:cupin superfamily acireductone dioxygenase involved in methionine salvage
MPLINRINQPHGYLSLFVVEIKEKKRREKELLQVYMHYSYI